MAISIDLTGKTALVTGGTRGIGRAISRRLAQAGARVGMIYRQDAAAAKETEDELNEMSGAGHFAMRADLLNEIEAGAAAQAAIVRLGGALDVLVLNAAASKSGAFADQSMQDWRYAFDINVFGHAAILKPSYSALRSGSSVIAISSGAAHDPIEGLSSYGASKAALNQLMAVLAQEWGPKGIRVNVVSPGSTAKEPVDYAHLSPAQQNNVATTALRRIGTADDVADAVLYFASSLSSFVTGQWLRVNGGRV